MGTTTLVTALSSNAETVLLTLHRTRLKRDRTKTAIKDSCNLPGAKVDAGLNELLRSGHVELDDDVVMLTELGRADVKRLSTRPAQPTYIENQTNVTQTANVTENSSVTFTGVRDAAAKPSGRTEMVTATPVSFQSLYEPASNGELQVRHTMATGTLPYLSAQAHPARANSAPPRRGENDRAGAVPAVRFALAFRSLRDGLPIPIFDQDRLGRSRDNQISLPHDVYLSQNHCRFFVRRSKTGPGCELLVEDLDSMNGVQVNGAYIEPNKPTLLKHGSRLDVGSLVFVVLEVPE